MKTLPILVITNALALALVVVLWVQQEDLKTQLSASRSHGDRGVATTVVDPDRIAGIEAALASLRRSRMDAGDGTLGALIDGGTDARIGDAEDGDPIARPDDAADEALDGPFEELTEDQRKAMEGFRRRVRLANQLNAEEDRVRRIVTGIDQLVQGNRIGAIDEKAKERVAESILAYRAKGPETFRKLRRDNNNFEGMERSDIGALFRAARDDLTAQAVKDLEDIVPAADAKVIVEETLNDRGMFRGDRGGGFPFTGRTNRAQRRGGGGQAGGAGRGR